MNFIFSLDLSMSNTGVAIFDKYNNLVKLLSIKTNSSDSHGKRLKKIYDVMINLKNSYKTNLIIIENAFTKFNIATQVLYRVHGLINFIFFDCEQIYISPRTVKLSIAGSGKAKKQELQKIVKNLYPEFDIKNEDESDAICIGLTYFKKIGAYKNEYTIK